MRKLISLLAGLIASFFAQAQHISHMDVFVQTHFNEIDSINDGDTIHLVKVFKEPQMFVVLADTIGINSFSVTLGSTNGGNDILDKIFSFSEEGAFLDGTSYIRDGNYIRLFLGKYITLPVYYAKVRATVSGSQQVAITFSGE